MGKAEGYGKHGGKPTAEQIQANIKARKIRVSSLDNELKGKKSPFLKNPSMADYMKAKLVNNAIFHSEFDPSLIEKENLEMAKELLGD